MHANGKRKMKPVLDDIWLGNIKTWNKIHIRLFRGLFSVSGEGKNEKKIKELAVIILGWNWQISIKDFRCVEY